METGIIVLIVVVIAIISYANKMRKSWDDSAEVGSNVSPNEEYKANSPYMHDMREDDELDEAENLEVMPILDRVENFKFTQYTPPPFIPTTGSFEAVSTEDDLISSFDYDEEDKATHLNPITNFDLKSAVIFSEILKPKWEN